MRKLFKLTQEVYAVYRGDGEHHLRRIMICAISSFVLAVSPDGLNKDALSTMGVVVSVLAGFSFTALFSGNYVTSFDLPKANSESDRSDIANLRKLFYNFRVRSRYFLTSSVIFLIATLILCVRVDLVDIMYNLQIIVERKYLGIHNVLRLLLSGFVRFIATFLFLELLYTFYRLSETIFAIIEIRSSYMDDRSSR